jgi:hypothetical protein
MHPRSFRPSFAGSRSDERRFCPTGSRPRKQQLDQNVRVGRSEIFDMQGALRSETEVAQLSSVDASQSPENGEPDGASAGIYFGPRRQSFESAKIVSSQRLGALPWCTLRRRSLPIFAKVSLDRMSYPAELLKGGDHQPSSVRIPATGHQLRFAPPNLLWSQTDHPDLSWSGMLGLRYASNSCPGYRSAA